MSANTMSWKPRLFLPSFLPCHTHTRLTMFRPAAPRCTRFLSLVLNPTPCCRLLSSGSYSPRDLPKPPAGISLPLAPHQQAFLAAGSSILAILNPWRYAAFCHFNLSQLYRRVFYSIFAVTQG
jgi:hypothetical protein